MPVGVVKERFYPKRGKGQSAQQKIVDAPADRRAARLP
jgi:hypothetical protein